MIKTIYILVLVSLLGGAFTQTEFCTYTSSDGKDYYIPNIVITETTDDGVFTAALCLYSADGNEYEGISGCAPNTAICFQDNQGSVTSYGAATDVLYADYVVEGQEELGVEITFGNGDTCAIDSAAQTKTIVTFVCDPTTDGKLVTPIAPSADDPCVLQFQVNSSSACPSDVFCKKIAGSDEDKCLSNPFCMYDTRKGKCEVNPNPDCRGSYRLHVNAAHVVGVILSVLALACCFVGLCVCVCASCARRRCKKSSVALPENETMINLEEVTKQDVASEPSTDAATSTADDEALAAAYAAAYAGAPAYLYYMPQDAAAAGQMQYIPMQYAHLNPYAFMPVPQEAADNSATQQ